MWRMNTLVATGCEKFVVQDKNCVFNEATMLFVVNFVEPRWALRAAFWVRSVDNLPLGYLESKGVPERTLACNL